MKLQKPQKGLRWPMPIWSRCKQTLILAVLGIFLTCDLLAASTDETRDSSVDLALAAGGELEATTEQSGESLPLADLKLDRIQPGIPVAAALRGSDMVKMTTSERCTPASANGPPPSQTPLHPAAFLFAGCFCLPFRKTNERKQMKQTRSTISLPIVAIAAMISITQATQAAPINDNFGSATVISSGIPRTVTGTNVDATKQSGEPTSVSYPPGSGGRMALGGASVWWRWTAADSGSVTIKTAVVADPSDSNSSNFDTQLGVYTGAALGSLTEVVSNEDHTDFDRGRSKVTFNAVGGTTYNILVDGWEGVTGSIVLHIVAGEGGGTPPPPPPPPNKYNLTINVAPNGSGSVSADPEQPGDGYAAGTVVTLTATGDDFVAWAGAASGSSTTVQVTMNANKAVTAIFGNLKQIIFQNPSRQLSNWYMDGTNFVAGTMVRNGIAPGAGWRAVSAGDFNGDGVRDIVLQHDGGSIAVWLMTSGGFSSAALVRNGISAGAAWRVVGAADFDGNGATDLLLQNVKSGSMAIWYLDGIGFVSATLVRNGLSPGAGWRAVGAGDINGDNNADIVFQNGIGKMATWFLTNGTFGSASLLREGIAVGTNWRLFSVADLDSDGSVDLLFQGKDGKIAVWLMDGTALKTALLLRNGFAMPTVWTPVALR